MLHEDIYDRYTRGELQLEELFSEVNEKVIDEDLFDELVGIDGVECTYQGDRPDYYGNYFSRWHVYSLLMDGQQVAEVYTKYEL